MERSLLLGGLLCLLMLLNAVSAQAQAQYYCFDNATSGSSYTWEIWSHTGYPAARTLHGTGMIPAGAPSGNTTEFRAALIANINTVMPAGWAAVLEFTDDLCPGWDTAMQVDSPDLSPATEFYLTFLQPIACTADGGFCDPDARVRQFVVDSFGVPVAANAVFCLGGVSTGTTYGWGYADTVALNGGLEATVAASGNTIPIRDNFVAALYSVEAFPDSGTPLYDLGVTAGYEFTTACSGGSWDTAFAVNSINAPLAIAVTETGGGAFIQVPLFGSVSFNPDITQASGTFFEFPLPPPLPSLGGPMLIGLGALLATIGTRWVRRRDP